MRKPFGEAGIITNLSRLFTLPSAPEEFQVQALRVFGNLCFDEGACQLMRHALTFSKDENRERVLDARIIPVALSLLKKDLPTLNKTVCGFCLNSSMDYSKYTRLTHLHGET